MESMIQFSFININIRLVSLKRCSYQSRTIQLKTSALHIIEHSTPQLRNILIVITWNRIEIYQFIRYNSEGICPFLEEDKSLHA